MNVKDSLKSGKPLFIEGLIRRSVKNLKPVYLNKNPRFYTIRNKLLNNLKPALYDNVTVIWDMVHWVSNSRITQSEPMSGNIFLKKFSGQTKTTFIRQVIPQWDN